MQHPTPTHPRATWLLAPALLSPTGTSLSLSCPCPSVSFRFGVESNMGFTSRPQAAVGQLLGMSLHITLQGPHHSSWTWGGRAGTGYGSCWPHLSVASCPPTPSLQFPIPGFSRSCYGSQAGHDHRGPPRGPRGTCFTLESSGSRLHAGGSPSCVLSAAGPGLPEYSASPAGQKPGEGSWGERGR